MHQTASDQNAKSILGQNMVSALIAVDCHLTSNTKLFYWHRGIILLYSSTQYDIFGMGTLTFTATNFIWKYQT